MTDIVLVPVTGGNNISAMNNNFDKIEEAINTDILHLKGGNNVMKQDLDLNGHQLLNHDTDLNDPDSLINVGDADSRYYNVSGDALAGNMNAAGNKILNLPEANAPHEPVRKNEFDASNAKTIRTPEAIPVLDNAGSRADKLLSFDGSGNPVAIAAANQSATDLELRLANNADPAKGASLVGFKPSTPSSTGTTVSAKFGQIQTPKDSGAVGDGVTNDQAAFDAVASLNPVISNGTYVTTKPLIKCIPFGGKTKGDAAFGCPFVHSSGREFYPDNTLSQRVQTGLSTTRVHFPFALSSFVSSLSNSTPGADSEGSFFQMTDNALTCTTNQLTGITASTVFVLRVRYNGTIQNTITVNWFDGAGVFLSNSTVFAGGSGDAIGTAENSFGVKETYYRVTSPASAARLNIEFMNYTGRNSKLYGVEVVTETAASRAYFGGSALGFKGFSGFKLNGIFNWAPSGALTFESILNELVWLKETFNVTSIRMWLGLDGGMVKSGGIFQSFTTTALANWDRFFLACEKMNFRVIPCLYNPIVTDFAHPINMNRAAMTDTNVRDGYVLATRQFIQRYRHVSNIVAWDVVNEPFFMLRSDGTNSYTFTQIADLMEVLLDTVEEESNKPRIISLADGSTSVYGLQVIDDSKFEFIDFHSYGMFIRFKSVNTIARKPMLINEFGPQSGASLDLTLSQSRQILQDAVGNVDTAWIWEAYVRGGTPGDYMVEVDPRLSKIIKDI